MPSELHQGDVISYMEMCLAVGVNLQRGMNFRLSGAESVILMSRRIGAPYEDQVDEGGKVLIYEGHDCSKSASCPEPKRVDQPDLNPGGSLTQNGLFADSVKRLRAGSAPPEKVKVFEKIRDGIWVYNGVFELLDYWIDQSTGRRVFKFELRLTHFDHQVLTQSSGPKPDDDRVIPSWVKLAVWKRDQGKCTACGANTGLHFDHVIPYSRGGSSRDPANVQILCWRHNLAKSDKIE